MADGKVCSIDRCENPALSRGWCTAHYARFRRHGDPLGGQYKQGECAVAECSRQAHTGGLCSSHAGRLRRHGDPKGGGLLRSEMQAACSIDGCEEKRSALGLCIRHYGNLKRRGDALATSGKAPNGALRNWIESHAGHEGEGCLIWPFLTKGYGNVRVGGRLMKAHRYMCVVAHGAPPTTAHHAAHSCGKGHEGCVHPQHIRWDTAKGNHADRYEHGTVYFGETCWNAVLTEDGVRWARSMAGRMTYKAMSKALGVHHATIRHAVVRSTWAWLD